MSKSDETGKKSEPKSPAPTQQRGPYNPYITGKAISKLENFFGREEVFRDVKNMLHNPSDNAIVLYGQRRIGKTSVLLQIKRQLIESGEFTPIYFDLMGKAAKPLDEVLYELAENIAFETGQPAPERAHFDAEGVYFRRTFLPGATNVAAPGGLVLLFDEFDVLDSHQEDVENRAVQRFFPYLQILMNESQQVKFYFVIGRRPEDLAPAAKPVLKGARTSRIGLLVRKEAEGVIRQAESNDSLIWTDTAVNKVWEWAHGHSYMTQLLCSVVWEKAYEANPSKAPHVEAPEVDAAIPKALEQGNHAFVWIWEGLPPAEQIVMAAMAAAGDVVITKEKLDDILDRSGVRLITRKLKLAPETLVNDWGLLENADGGYRFVVPMLREWVATKQPMSQVKEALDQIDPLAENLFKTGQKFYGKKDYDNAIDQLSKALNNNPNHFNAKLLLGKIYYERDQMVKAIEVLQEAYDSDQEAAQEDLIKALLKHAEGQTDDKQQLSIYERILRITSTQRIAREKRQGIWRRRGEAYKQQKQWDEALNAFQEADDAALYEETGRLKHRDEFDNYLARVEQGEKAKDWNAAIRIWELLIKDYSDLGEFHDRLKKAQGEASLERRYQNALEAIAANNYDDAKQLLVDIIVQQVDYKEALRHLMRATLSSEVDVAKLGSYKAVMRRKQEDELQETPAPVIEAEKPWWETEKQWLQEKTKAVVDKMRQMMPDKPQPAEAPEQPVLVTPAQADEVLPAPVPTPAAATWRSFQEQSRTLLAGGLELIHKFWEKCKTLVRPLGQRLGLSELSILVSAFLIIAIIAFGMWALLRTSSTSGSHENGSEPVPNDKPPVAIPSSDNLSFRSVAENLKAALHNNRPKEIAQYTRWFIDHQDSLKILATQKWYSNVFDDSLFARAVALFHKSDNAAAENMATFLRELKDQQSLASVKNELLTTNNPKAKQLCLNILEGFTKSGRVVICDIKTWLGIEAEQEWQDLPEIQKTYLKFKPPAVSGNTSARDRVIALRSALSANNKNDAADFALALSDENNLSSLISEKGIWGDFDYYQAKTLLETGNECQSRSMTLFLSRVQTKELREKICKNFWKPNSSAKAKQLYLFVLAGVAKNSKEKNEVTSWLQNKLKQESGEIAKHIKQTLGKLSG